MMMADRDNAPVLCIIVPCYIEQARAGRHKQSVERDSAVDERKGRSSGVYILYVDDRRLIRRGT